MSRLKFIRQGLVLSGSSGWCNNFFESLDYKNEHFEGFGMFWTVKVGLKCCCEKANIGVCAILSRYR